MKKKRKLGRKLLSFLITLALAVGLMPGMTAYADSVTSWNENQTIESNQEISGGVTIGSDITVTVSSGVVLTVNGGINANGKTVTVNGSGTLIINGATGSNGVENNYAALNGEAGGYGFEGNIIVDGATVTVTGGTGGIGSNDGSCGYSGGAGGNGVVGNVTVNSGSIVVTGGTGGNGGGGPDGDGGSGGNGGIGVNGTVTVTGGSATLAGGIGGEAGSGSDGDGENGEKGEAVSGTITGSAEESGDNNAWTAVSGDSSTKQYVKVGSAQTHTHDSIPFTAWTETDKLPTNTGSYYLTNDVTMSRTWGVYENITLCLNGHGIIANHRDSPIEVGSSGNLTLVDDNGAGSTHYYYIAEDGRGHIVDQGEGNYQNASGDRKGSFTGGYITVADNVTAFQNGIVDMMNNASFTMKGGTIIGGTGRGVELASSSFTMSAGNIIGNTEGGVCANNPNAVFNMKGGVISYNNQYGVGLYNCDSFNVSGNPTITKNKNSNVACNVLVKSDNKLTIVGALTNTTPIGVTMDEPGVFTSSPNSVKAKAYATQFKSDSDSYTVEVESDELKLAPSQEHDKANAVAATVTANNRTYDGTEKPLVAVSGTPIGGTMQYVIGTSATTAPTSGWSTSIPKGTDVGTYYVWYMVKADDNHKDSEAKCLTVKIDQKSDSGGGSNTPSMPSTPTVPVENYTVPVSNEQTVNITTSISEGNAVVGEITQSDIDEIVNKNSESGTEADENTSITIDVSKAKSEVTSIEIPKTTIERLADTASEQNNNVDTVTVQMTNAKVELDAETLAAVSEQADGKNVRLVVDDKLEQASLNEKQRDVISTYEKATTFEAYFESDGKRIHDFKGGTAKVSVRYSLVSGLLARFIHMLYLNPTGEVERFTTTYDGEWCTGDLPHFSEYAIVYDTSVSNKTGTEEDAAEAEKIAKDPYTGLDPEDWDADENDFVADETTILPNGKTAYKNGLAINSGLRLIQKGKTLTVTWGKVKGATGYKVYAEYCGTKMPDKPIKTIKNGSKVKVVIKKLHGKKLNKKKNYKVCVVAYKTVDGVDKVLGRTVTAHVIGANNKKYSNPKKLTIVSKTKLSLKTGKSAKIRSKVTLVNKKRKSLSDAHAPMFRYASTNKKVATVNKKGKIKAVGKGQCYIWVYAKNGYGKKVKVTVS